MSIIFKVNLWQNILLKQCQRFIIFAHTLRLDLFSMINLSVAITSSTFYDTINSITTSIKDLCHAIFLQRKKENKAEN